MYEYLLDNGLTAAEYHWFIEQPRAGHCVMGTDYYETNEHLVAATARPSPAGEIFGYYVITRQYFDRYRLPVMHTETNIAEPRSVAVALEGVGQHGASASRTASRSSASPGTA